MLFDQGTNLAQWEVLRTNLRLDSSELLKLLPGLQFCLCHSLDFQAHPFESRHGLDFRS